MDLRVSFKLLSSYFVNRIIEITKQIVDDENVQIDYSPIVINSKEQHMKRDKNKKTLVIINSIHVGNKISATKLKKKNPPKIGKVCKFILLHNSVT